MQHQNIKQDWMNRSIAYQMGNIGSEVSRAFKNVNNFRFQGAFDRALELFDVSIEIANQRQNQGQALEIMAARDEFCNYFYDNNSYNSDPKNIQKYYDQFAIKAMTEP